MENITIDKNIVIPPTPEILEPDEKSEQSELSDISNDEIIFQSMKQKVEDLHKSENFINSKLRITAYRDHNKNIKREMRDRSLVLDKRYNFYTSAIDTVQISIILLASLSAFIQATHGIYHIDSDTISFITLIISTYTGLVLAILKYKKYDERKEGIHNLQQQFAEFLVDIECRDDKLNTWGSDKLWAGGYIDNMIEKWNKVDDELFEGLKPLIEKKQMLCCEFEKQMDISTQGRLQVIARTDQLQIKRDKNNVRYQELQILKRDIALNDIKKKIAKKQRKHYSTEGYQVSNSLFSPHPKSLPGSEEFSSGSNNIEVIVPDDSSQN